MNRRKFLKSTASAGMAVAWNSAKDSSATAAPSSSPRFTPCINQATTMQADFRAAMDAYHKAGFRAVELWLDSVEPFVQKESAAVARRVMADLGLQPVSSCCEEDLFFPRLKDRESKLEKFRRKLERSAELGARRFVMYSAIFEDVSPADYAAALPHLGEVGDLGKQFGITVGIEFIKGAKFLGCLPTTAELLREVRNPNLGVLLDTFHFYAGTSKLEDLERVKPGEISFVHIDDVPAKPRELLEDQDRVYLGEGVMPLKRILRALAPVYQGPLSFEVFQYGGRDPYAVAKRSFDGLSRLLTACRPTLPSG